MIRRALDRPRRFSNRRWLVLLAVALGPLILVGRELVQGRVLFWGTPALQFVPWWLEGLRQIALGQAPLWNSLNGMGAPLLANYQTAFFYPPNWLLFLFHAGWGAAGLAWGFTFLAMLHLVWGGWGMAAWLRRLNAGWLAQAVGGTAFALCGYWVGRLEFLSMIWVGAWMPWFLRYVDEIASPVNLNASREKSGWLHLRLTLVLTMMLLAGHAQLSWYSLELAGVWLLAGIWLGADWRGLPRAVGRLAGAGVVAALLAAVQLVPTAEYLLQSQRASAVGYEQALVYSFWPWRLVSLLAPDFFGNPGQGNYWGYASYWEDHAYLGVLLLLMAFSSLGRLLKKKDAAQAGWLPRPVVWLLWGVIAVALVLGFGRYTPVFPFLYRYVPTFSMFQAPARILVWLVLALILLGASGVDRWRYPAGRGLYWLRLGTAGALAVTLGAGLGWLLLDNVRLTFVRATALAGLWTLGVGVLSLLTRYRERPGWRIVWPGLVYAWVLLDLLVAGWQLNPTVAVNFYTQTSATVERLETDLAGQRVFLGQADEYFLKFNRFLRFQDYRAFEDRGNIKRTLLPDTNLYSGIALISNFDPLVPGRYAAWMDALNQLPEERQQPWLQMMNVGALEKLDGRAPHGVRFDAFEGGFPAAFYSCVQVVEAGDEPLLRMAQAEFDRSTLLVETDLPGELPACDGSPPVTVSPARQSAGRVEFEVPAGESGWLFVSQTWYPGWVASVDGQETPLYRANFLFVALQVPPGAREVVLQYRPISYQVGKLLSILMFIGVLATILIRPVLKRRMGSSGAGPTQRSK